MADSTNVGIINLGLDINQQSFNKQLNGIANGAKSSVLSAFKPLGKLIGGALAAGAIVKFTKSCIELGSDLTEVQNVVDTTFTTMSDRVNEFAKSAIDNFGLSETVAKNYMGVLGTMSKSMGFTESQAYDMAEAVTALSGDVASFYNMTSDEAYNKLKSIWTGETESLKSLGVMLTQTNLDQYALNNGFGKTTAAMTEQEKVMLRYQYTLSALSAAQNDFSRTSDSWANQVRVLSLRFDALKASIGQGLINAFTPVIRLLNTLLAKIQAVADAFSYLTGKIFGKATSTAASTASSATSAISDAVGSSVGGIADTADAATSATKTAEKEAKKLASMTGSLDELNVLSPASDTSDTGSGSGTGTGGIGGGELVDFGEPTSLTATEQALDSVSESLDALYQKILEYTQPSIDALQNLWNNGLAKLGEFTWTAIGDFYNNCLVPIGQWVLGEGFPRFINAVNEGLMNTDFNKITTALNNLWDSIVPFTKNVGDGLLWFFENVVVPLGKWVNNNVVPRFLDTLANVIDVLNNILSGAKPAIQWFFDNVLYPIAKWTGGIFLSVWDSINEALAKFGDWCNEHQGVISTITTIALSFGTALFTVKTAISAVTNVITICKTVMSAFTTVIGLVTSPVGLVVTAIGALIAAGVLLYQNWDTVKAFCSETWQSIKDTITTFITNVKETIIRCNNEIKEKWTTVWNAIKTFFTSIWEGIKKTVSTAINSVKTTVSTVLSAISDKFTSIWNGIKNAVSTAINAVKNTINSVMSTIKGGITSSLNAIKEKFTSVFTSVKNTVTGIFTGMWNVIKNIINSILGGIEKMANGVVKGINKVISALNNLSFDVPDWVPGLGGKTFGFSIPSLSEVSIPRLAEGGYVQPNTPQLAMIGDNKTQGEIVAPEDKLRELLNEAVNSSGNAEAIQLLKEIIIVLKDILESILGISLDTEVDGRELLVMLKNVSNRNGAALIT